MNDHKFSNQKSALEEYFESLLSDDDIQTEVEATETVVVVEAQVIEPVVDQSDIEQANVNPESKPDQTQILEHPVTDAVISASLASEPEPEPEPEPVVVENKAEADQAKRTSVEEMLAAVEEKSQTVADQLPDFAEPEPAITLPLPEVAPPATEIKTEIKTETVVESEVEEQTSVEQVVEQEAAVETPVVEATVREATSPDWAESPFQCLLFNVGGLSLAVPLVRLNGVIPWTENVVETPNQTEWYLGVLMNHGHKVQVIDTAVMVLPPEHRVDLAEEPAERLSHILLVDDQRWGLACDSIGDVVWLKKDEVKWRSNKTKRPWLLGTAINHMCAVMDTEAFADMLEEKK